MGANDHGWRIGIASHKCLTGAIGPLQAGSFQVRFAEPGSLQVGFAKTRSRKERAAEVRPSQVRSTDPSAGVVIPDPTP
jgi:hypothetical protein